MLKFVESGQNKGERGIRRQPDVQHGMSWESPKEFVNQHSFMSQQAYLNPHLSYQEHLKVRVPSKRKQHINPSWIHKTNLSQMEVNYLQIQDQKVVNIQGQQQQHDYHNHYRDELKKNQHRFQMTKGEFSSFLQQQQKNRIFGPLDGKERSEEKAHKTRRMLQMESIRSMEKLKSDMSRYSSMFQKTRQKSLLKEKYVLRTNRQTFYQKIKGQLDDRKHRRSQQFLLPKVMKKGGSKTQRRYAEMLNTIDAPSVKTYRY